jgi:hypothetical protein
MDVSQYEACADKPISSRSAHTLPCKKTTAKLIVCETDYTSLYQIVIIGVQAQLALCSGRRERARVSRCGFCEISFTYNAKGEVWFEMIAA